MLDFFLFGGGHLENDVTAMIAILYFLEDFYIVVGKKMWRKIWVWLVNKSECHAYWLANETNRIVTNLTWMELDEKIEVLNRKSFVSSPKR